MKSKEIIGKDLNIINVGISIFYDALKKQNVKVAQVNWRPPAEKDKKIESLLKKLTR
mgnify:CR=1 FL=1